MCSRSGLYASQSQEKTAKIVNRNLYLIKSGLVIRRPPFTLKPFSGLYNPYPFNCSLLCNHPTDNETKKLLQKAKDTWATEGRNLLLAEEFKEIEIITANLREKEAIVESVPDELFRHYTETDSRSLTPPVTECKNGQQLNKRSSLRRCLTPDPPTNQIKEKTLLVLDLRRSHSQETLSLYGDGGGSSSMTLVPSIITIEKVPKQKQNLIYSPKLSTTRTQTTHKDLKSNNVNDNIGANNNIDNNNNDNSDKRHGSKRRRRKHRDHSVLPQQQMDPVTQIEQIIDENSMKEQHLHDLNDENNEGMKNSNRVDNNCVTINNCSYLDWTILRQLRCDLDEKQIENEFNFKRKIALEEALKTIKTTTSNKGRTDCVELECLKKELQSNKIENDKKIDFYLKLPRKFSRANIQFEFPFDRHSLEKMSPLQYVKNYVTITPSKKFFYRCVYDKILTEINQSAEEDDEKEEEDGAGEDDKGCRKQRYFTTLNLFAALDIMMGNPLSKQQKTYFHRLLDFDNMMVEGVIDFQQFCGICALCERLFASEFDPKFPSRLLDPPNEIEIADFQALPRKLSDLNINENLLEILNKINTL